MSSDHAALPGPATLHDSALRHLDGPWLAFLLTPPALVLTIRACVRGEARLPVRPTRLLLGLALHRCSPRPTEQPA
jgi:hypothetical protein